MTRRSERLNRLVIQSRALLPQAAPPAWRAFAFAAAVAGTMAGLAGAARADAAPEPARPSPGARAAAVLTGQVLDDAGVPLPEVTVVVRDRDHEEWSAVTGADGSFVFEELPAGTYIVEANLPGFRFEARLNFVLQPGGQHQVAFAGEAFLESPNGSTANVEIPLRSAFRRSRLVVIATVGPSVQLAEPRRNVPEREVRTELEVAAVLKGTWRGGTVRVDRFEIIGGNRPPRIGETVLAFLTPPEAGAGWADDAAHVPVDTFYGLRQLPADTLQAYRRRIAALARLGEAPRPGEVVEWLVATAEDEHTREEAVIELEWAVRALKSLGEQQARSLARPGEAAEWDTRSEVDRLLARTGAPETGSAVLAALLTPDHRERLSRALLATQRLADADLRLYELVRPWAGEAAARWLARQLAGEPGPDHAARRAMRLLAEELRDEGLQKLLDQGEAEIHEACDQILDTATEWNEAEAEGCDQRVEALEQELTRKFLRALNGRP